MSKAIQITDDVYRDMVKAKPLAYEILKKEGKNDEALAVMAMGIGAFSGWLIYRSLAGYGIIPQWPTKIE